MFSHLQSDMFINVDSIFLTSDLAIRAAGSSQKDRVKVDYEEMQRTINSEVRIYTHMEEDESSAPGLLNKERQQEVLGNNTRAWKRNIRAWQVTEGRMKKS